jgi:hypothetical protein
MDVVGSTYWVNEPLSATATTGSSWVAYKVHNPLPPDLGDINWAVYEDGERPLRYTASRQDFEEASKQIRSGSLETLCCDGIFTPNWTDYKYQETSVTVANGSREVTVADHSYYDIGDVVLFAGKYLHRITGISTTDNNLWLDKNYVGTTTIATMTLNPIEHTEYLTFYGWPTDDKEVILDGYVRPTDMVADTDVSPFPDRIVPALIIGALLEDKMGRDSLTEQCIMNYQRWIKSVRSKKNNMPAPRIDNRREVRRSDEFGWSNSGLST